MNEDESVELDAVAAVARITALEMLVRQMMIVQLRILDRMGEIKLTPDYVKGVAAAYAEKVDASPIIEFIVSGSELRVQGQRAAQSGAVL